VIKFTIDGKEVRPDQIGKELTKVVAKAAFEQVSKEMRERLEAIRHPETEEFPTVVVFGDSIESISFKIEGSAQLLEIIRERLTPEELLMVQFPDAEPGAPRAFLSFAWEDKELAERIARAFQAEGIDTWFAGWSLAAGDSMRQEIDKGLAQCTHFVVLLTPDSVGKPWVNQEMDAGLVRKIEAKAKFIALRKGVLAAELPPLLKGMISPSLDDFAPAMRQLIDDIHGVSRKPPLGAAPAAATLPKTGYSAAASAIAKVFVDETTHATFGDPQRTIDELQAKTGLSEEDVHDAVHELHGMVQESFDRILPKDELFAVFDKHFAGRDPADDALRIAADLVNDDGFPTNAPEIAERYGWTARRLNPALAYLFNRKLIQDFKAMGTQPWLVHWVQKTDSTRRFVKSRS
jgi:hypothetical protein